MFNATAARSNVPAVAAHANTSQLSAHADTSQAPAFALKLINRLLHCDSDWQQPEWVLTRTNLTNYLKAVLSFPYDKRLVNPTFKMYAKEFNRPCNELPETLPRNSTLLAAALILSVYPDQAFSEGRLDRDFFFAALEHHTDQPQDALRRSIQAEDLDSVEVHSVASDGTSEVIFLPGLRIPLPAPAADAAPAPWLEEAKSPAEQEASSPTHFDLPDAPLLPNFVTKEQSEVESLAESSEADPSATSETSSSTSVDTPDLPVSPNVVLVEPSEAESPIESSEIHSRATSAIEQSETVTASSSTLSRDPSSASLPTAPNSARAVASTPAEPPPADAAPATALVIAAPPPATEPTLPGMPPHAKVQKFDIETVEAWIKAGYPINVVDPRGHTMLHFACNRKPVMPYEKEVQKKIFNMLLQAGAAPFICNETDETAIDFACKASKTDMVIKMLHAAGVLLRTAPENMPSHDLMWRMLEQACEYGEPSLIDAFHHIGIPVLAMHPTKDWYAPEHATRFGQAAVLDRLLALGADIRTHSGDKTVLEIAEGQSNDPTCERLLEAFRGLLGELGKKLLEQRPLCEAAMRLACRLNQADLVSQLLGPLGQDHADAVGSTCLHNASRFNATGIAQTLLDAGADSLRTDNRGRTALHAAAAQEKHEKMVALLAPLKNGQAVHAGDVDGNTPLHMACRIGHQNVIRILLEAGAEIGQGNRVGQTPLHLAMLLPNAAVVRQFLEDPRRYEGRLNSQDRLGNTPLHTACARHGASWALPLIVAGADPDLVNLNDETPFDIAVQEKNVAILDQYLARLPKQAIDRLGQFLRAACRYQQPEIVQHLLGHSLLQQDGSQAQLRTPLQAQQAKDQILASCDATGRTALHIACLHGDVGIVSLLLQAGADRGLKDKAGNLPLTLAQQGAAESGGELFDGVIDLLYAPRPDPGLVLHTAAADGNVEAAAAAVTEDNLNVPDAIHQRTPLRWASFYGQAKIVDLLIARNADVGWVDSNTGRTALHDAALGGFVAICQVLLDKLPNQIHHADKQGLTPLHCAAQRGHVDALRCLLQRGARVDDVDGQGMTALQHAAHNGHQAVVQALLNAKADPDRMNSAGKTAARLARDKNHTQLAEILRAASKHRDLEVALYDASHAGRTKEVERLLALGADPEAPQNRGWRPLHSGASRGFEKVARALLDAGAKVNALTDHHNTPLHKASEKGFVEVVKVLLERRANPNLLGSLGSLAGLNALEMAKRGNHWKVVVLLCEAMGLPVPERPTDNVTQTSSSSTSAASPERRETVTSQARTERPKALYNNVPAPETPAQKIQSAVQVPPSTISSSRTEVPAAQQAVAATTVSTSTTTQTATSAATSVAKSTASTATAQVHRQQADLAVADSDATRLREVLNTADINATNVRGETVLHRVVQRNQRKKDELTMLDAVLEQHPDINAVDGAGDTALHIAATHGNRNIFRRLLRVVGIDLHARDRQGNTPGHRASIHGHTDLVLDWQARGADLSRPNQAGQTVKETAIASGNTFLAAQLDSDLKPWQRCWQSDDANKLAKHLGQQPSIAAPEANGHTWLHEASHGENPQILRMLLARKFCDVNVKNSDGRTPLHLACAAGQVDAVQQLTKARADLDAKDKQGMTPLMLACQHGQLSAVDELLRHNELNIDMTDYGYRTALHWAAEAGAEQIVWTLLSHGADPLAEDGRGQSLLDVARRNNQSEVVIRMKQHPKWELHCAALDGDIETLKRLLARGVDIDSPNKDGVTALHVAAGRGHVDAVKLLLDKKASIDARNRYGKAPLHWAALYGHVDVTKLLLEKNANIEAVDKDGRTALHGAAGCGHVDVTKLLLEKNANIEAVDKYGQTALHLAAREGHVDLTKLLLEKNANIEAISTYGYTALHWAARYGHVDLTKLLLEKNANIEAKNQDDSTVLHWAAGNGRIGVTQLLLQSEANIEARNNNGETALHCATKCGYVDVIRLLLQNNANIEAIDKNGYTPLHWAALNGHFDITHLLLQNNANIEAKNQDDSTALHWAALNGHVDVIKLLLQNKANIEAVAKNGSTALHRAAWSGHVDVTNLLLQNNANIEAKNQEGNTALHWAAACGHVDTTKLLLHNNANIEARNQNSSTALHWAALSGHVDVTKLLLQNNANIKAIDKDGYTALRMAVEQMHGDIAQLLSDAESNTARAHPRHKPGAFAQLMRNVALNAVRSSPRGKADAAPHSTDSDSGATAKTRKSSLSNTPAPEKSTRKSTHSGVISTGTSTSAPQAISKSQLTSTTTSTARSSNKKPAPQPTPSSEKTSRTKASEEKTPPQTDASQTSASSSSQITEKKPQRKKE